jgi:CRISPR-associated protein (TIGR03986 family)
MTGKLPQHKNPTQEDRIAVAPYNFVPLPEKVVTLHLEDLPAQDAYSPGRFSGHLACELETSSPLYVRAARSDQQSQKDSLPEAFYYADDPEHPVIPGSSLRGLLRSMVEVVSYSKISAVTNEKQIYRAVGDITDHGKHYRDQIMRDDGEHNREKYYTPLVKGGYIVQKGHDWYIQPAQTIGGTTYAHLRQDEDFFRRLKQVPGCKNAFTVYIECGPYDYQAVKGGFLRVKFARVIRADDKPGPGLRKATLAISGWMASKRSEAVIFEQDEHAPLLELSDEQIEDYEAQISQEQKKLLGDKGVLQKGQPVFYIVDDHDKVVFFGHGRMLRMPYPNSPLDKVPTSLRREGDIDLAEAIFGYVKSNQQASGKARSYAGRVFVCDANVIEGQKDLWLTEKKTITLNILGGPKPTTFQHYLVQGTPDKIKMGETRDGKAKFDIHLADYTSQDTTIRGQKFYWHKGVVGAKEIGADVTQVAADEQRKKKTDTQHAHVQPLRAGVRFQFKIHFENLSDIELGALLWVLRVAAQDEYRLKLGMGKPLGMGAVRIAAKTYLVDRTQRYQQLFLEDNWASGLKEDPAAAGKIAAFEQFILNGLEQPAKRLEDVERVQSLLTMLRWPGPDPEMTRYMEIEREDPTAKRGKRNEYKERPVLPTPLAVWAKSGGKVAAPPSKASQTTSDQTAKSGGEPAEPYALQRRRLLSEKPPAGRVRGTVVDAQSGRYGKINPAGGGGPIFVHIKQVKGGNLRDNQVVEYQIGQYEGRPQAQEVTILLEPER